MVKEIIAKNKLKYSNIIPFKKGGMGEIYKANEDVSGETRIIKFIPIFDPTEEEPMMREIAASESISHPNVVKTYTTGKLTDNNIDYLYIVQEYYPSGNLRSHIKNNIDLQLCYSMMLDILNGMSEIHKTFVHRDIKPENILVNHDSHLLVTDLGLAKFIDEQTKTKSFKGGGTIAYMPPECWTGEKNTISMDIYSLGILFFELLTGTHPYNAKTETEWKDCHLFSPLPDIQTFRSNIPVKVKEIVTKMTRKKIIERYSSLSEIIEALNRTIQLTDEESTEIQRLAKIATLTNEKKISMALETAKQNDIFSEWIKSLNYQITDLFERFKSKIKAINEHLENEKIQIKESTFRNESTSRTLAISFNGKSVQISFGNSADIEEYEKNRQATSAQRQKNTYGMILHDYKKSFLKENQIVLIGLAETKQKIVKYSFGFNLLLKQNKESQYGDWMLINFSENVQPPTTSFGLDLNIFLDEYEKVKGDPYMSSNFKPLTDDASVSLIEKII